MARFYSCYCIMMNYFLCDQNVLTHTCFNDSARSLEADMGAGTEA